MASSSDWLTALVERPKGGDAGPKPLSWLPGLVEPESGFVGGLPFDRTSDDPDAPSPASSDSPPDEMNGDELVDILREALGESDQEAGEAGQMSEPEPEPDPTAEAYARGEEAGRQAVLAAAEVKSQQKLALRQTFRTLDQAAMNALAGDLAETVVALCSQTLADYTPDADTLNDRCNQAAQRLGAGPNGVVLHLHPDDLSLFDEKGLGDWEVIGDPSVERGGLRLESEDGSISDRPSDWRRAIADAIRG